MWKVSKYGVFSGPYCPVFGLNTGKCGLEKTPYLDTFHAVSLGVSKVSFYLKYFEILFHMKNIEKNNLVHIQVQKKQISK